MGRWVQWTTAVVLLGCAPFAVAGPESTAAPDAPPPAKPSLSSRIDPVDLQRPPGIPDDATLEAEGARVGTITLRALEVFDTSRADERNWLFETANRLHVGTRKATIADRLLFREGDVYEGRLLQESERLLRAARFLYDASVRPVRYVDGRVDIEVITRDVWTLNPGVSFGRKGGKSTSGFELEELNLFGRGTQVNVKKTNDVDRDITSARYVDRQLGSTWWALEAEHSDFSDGGARRLLLEHPFYALDVRLAGGFAADDSERIDTRYDRGTPVAEYRVDSRLRSAWVGVSRGLREGRVTRWSVGFTADERKFGGIPASVLQTALPADRKLVYPWIDVEWLQDDFRAARNLDQIGRTEDFQYGWRVDARLGYSSTAFGADRDAWVFSSRISRGIEWGAASETRTLATAKPQQTLLFAAALAGRHEDDAFADLLLSGSARYYRRQSERRLFFAGLSVDIGENLDADRELMLGGDTGLRGYPLRYRGGQGRWLLTLEQRVYTDWYPFRLFHVGAAAFVDAGGTWGRDPFARQRSGVLGDAGVGLRLGNSRSGLGNVIHVDLAFPLGAEKSIDSMQLLIETKRSF